MLTDKKEIAAYCAAFIDGEGTVGFSKTAKGNLIRNVSFCNTDKQLFDRVVHYFQVLGFEVTVYKRKKHANPRWAQCWVAYVCRTKAAITLFKQVIPLQAERKQARIDAIVESISKPIPLGRARAGIETPCEVCGTPVYVNPCFRARGGGRFCSVACRAQARRKLATHVCKHCGKEYQHIPSRKSKYCSPKCYGAASADTLRGQASAAAKARWAKRDKLLSG